MSAEDLGLPESAEEDRPVVQMHCMACVAEAARAKEDLRPALIVGLTADNRVSVWCLRHDRAIFAFESAAELLAVMDKSIEDGHRSN